MSGGINNIYMGGYKFSAHCTNISAHKIYFRASLFICGEYFLDRTAIDCGLHRHIWDAPGDSMKALSLFHSKIDIVQL